MTDIKFDTKYIGKSGDTYSAMTLNKALDLMNDKNYYGNTAGHYVVFNHSTERIVQIGDRKQGSLNTLRAIVG